MILDEKKKKKYCAWESIYLVVFKGVKSPTSVSCKYRDSECGVRKCQKEDHTSHQEMHKHLITIKMYRQVFAYKTCLLQLLINIGCKIISQCSM